MVNRAEDFLHKVPTQSSTSSSLQLPIRGQVDEGDDEPGFQELLEFTFPKAQTHNDFVSQIGQVEYVGDGICKISGIDDARIEDIVNIKTETSVEKALILGISSGLLETVIMGDYSHVKRGDQALSTGKKLSIGVGDGMIGRVVDPMGMPLDGKGDIEYEQIRPIEFPGPPIMAREPIYEPLETGVMVIDATIPVGKGQRELIIGDRKSGKTRTALDIISNQKGKDIFCVYVGVGMQAAKAKEALKLLEKRGAMEYTTIVMSMSDGPPTLQYIAPYSGSAIAEHYMYQGKHCLIIYDDLSKQAKAYRQVSLLLKRSPGRDAYPGDIFFLHSRLLERAAKLHTDKGAGSITALPVAQTINGDVSEYIITNLMSITDGHIFLDTKLMNEGILPAVNSGLSVSRIGGKVQVPLLRKVSELAGRQLARYNEVKSFETMNTEVAEETKREILRGKHVLNMFAQDSNMTINTDEQILLLALATSGRTDLMNLRDMDEFKRAFVVFYREQTDAEDFKQKCQESKELDDIEPYIDHLISQFQKATPEQFAGLQTLMPEKPGG